MQDNGFASPGPHALEQGNIARIVYALYLAGLVIGVTAIIGLVMAYIYEDGAPPWVETHYRYQIRTFWLGILFIVVGVLLCFLFVGYLILLFWLVWVVVRCVKGLKLLSEGRAQPNPSSWRL
jgi:uncharacterized membrane protein